jgi:hypothetical protein
MVPTIGESHNKKSESILGHKFVWSRVIVKVLMLQLEDELLGKGRGNVRCQGPNGPRGPLGLGLGIRSSPCLGVK